jgi:subtilisin family serine protease
MFSRAFLVVVALVAALALPAISFAAASSGSRFPAAGDGAWLVQFRSDVPDRTATRVVRASGATQVGDLSEVSTHVVKTTDSRVLERLAADARVVSVQKDGTASVSVVPHDPHWEQGWGPRLVHAPEAWSMSTGRATTVIAIVDTGVDPRQPDLRGRVLRGWDFQNHDANANDDNGHGTAVAGVAAAAANDRVGIAGMCWQCRILPVKVLNAAGSGAHSNIAAGIVWATKHGADVINMSLAGQYSADVIRSAVAYARNHGVVVVAAAGNEGSARPFYPAAYPGVISVGASTGTDSLYSWSNRGRWVKLTAPGCAYTGKPGPAWSWWCGTSFAAPVVAGIAALVKSLNPGLSRSQIERILLASSVNVRGVADGRIDAMRALRRAASLTTNGVTPTASYDWNGKLDRSHQRTVRTMQLSGREQVQLQWSNHTTLWLTFKDSAGRIVRSVHNATGNIRVQLALKAGSYTVTIGTFATAPTTFTLTTGD